MVTATFELREFLFRPLMVTSEMLSLSLAIPALASSHVVVSIETADGPWSVGRAVLKT